MNHLQTIKRRTVLRGVGASLALPWLEIMPAPVVAATGDAKPPTRLATILFPNGVRTKTWRPQNGGRLTDLPAALQPLESVKDDVLVVSGLSNNLCKDAPHHRAIAGFLTGSDPKAGRVLNGVSADQLAAQQVGRYTRIPSMVLGLPEVLQKQGNCDGYSCVYTRNISWRNATTPVPKEINPRNAFDQLFRHLVRKAEPSSDEMSWQQQNLDDTSVLDYVLEDAKDLRKKLGQADKVRLDQYLDSVREVEQRINRVVVPEHHRGDWSPSIPSNLAGLKPDTPTTIHEHLLAMMDLIALAFQTDSTRIASLMLGYGSSWNTYPESGTSEQHHTVSHYGENSGKADIYTRLNRYHASTFAYLIEKLRAIPEADGSLLDNCIVLFGSELGVGGRHNVNELPVLLGGRGGGTITTGRHVIYEQDTPMAGFLLELLNRMQLDTPISSLGEADQPVGGLA